MTHVSNYCQQTITNLVDHAIIYSEKTHLDKSQDIPFSPVPSIGEENSPKYKNIRPVEIFNEINQPSGKFGW